MNIEKVNPRTGFELLSESSETFKRLFFLVFFGVPIVRYADALCRV
jgi:hypothetical protein